MVITRVFSAGRVQPLLAAPTDYVVKGKMIGGFGLLAFPADYGNSGIMTFMVNQDGTVFQKDLGDRTEKFARRIETFDPAAGWQKVEP